MTVDVNFFVSRSLCTFSPCTYIVQSLIQNLIIFVFMRVCSVVTKSSVPSLNFVTHLSLWSFPMMTPGYIPFAIIKKDTYPCAKVVNI